MKKPFVALLLMVGAAAMVASTAFAQGEDLGLKLQNAKMVKALVSSRAARLSVSAGPDPDTVYVGKSWTDHRVFSGPNVVGNYWNVYTGNYLPGTVSGANAFWDWDNSVGIGAPDSLHGWWPMHRQYNSTGGLTLTDDQRPWWALDHGNVANYVLSQQTSAKRTFGVVGVWHADPGGPGNAVMWTPLSGTKSCWCGLRQQPDATVSDAVTGNPFNSYCVWGLHDATAAGGGSPNNFPGYIDQMDQMLYRDVLLNSTQSLTVSFKYRTRMSTSITTTATTRTGWFHGDPLAVTNGNFISSSAAGTSAPQDSFMVYVGAPVNEAACVYSDGVTRPVYDKQRRWFSEVLKAFGAGSVYSEIFAATGNNPSDSLAATPTAGPIVVPAGTIASILSPATSGTVRLVFRCKTNRSFADSDTRSFGYTSAGKGAVLLDDITIQASGGPVNVSDFEGSEQGGANQIDNRFPLPPALGTTDVWRSTGKPPNEYFHIQDLSTLTYNDLCGPPNSTARLCNIGGLVLTPGNSDDGQNAGDSRFTAFREISQECVSPTINLLDGPTAGSYNNQGMRQSIANFTDDCIIWYDLYAGMFNLQFSGETWNFGSMAYPSSQPNGAKIWGNPRYSGFIVFNPEPQCFTDAEPFLGNGTPFRTSNASGIPDSLRFWFAHQQQCFRFAISLGCNSNEGGYFDNAALAFIDQPGLPGQASSTNASIGGISSDIWHFVNDTFPANETVGLPGSAAFDTTTGLIRTGINTAQATGNSQRFDIPGDSSVTTAGNATVVAGDDPALVTVRVDLVFRVLPGPGNYQIAGARSMVPGSGSVTGTLLQLPTNQAAVAVSGDGSWWGTYMASPGEVSAGTHAGGWNILAWNSARMDSAEVNIFPVGGSVPTGTGLVAGNFMTDLHEADPRYLSLGVNKFKCFVVDTTKAATATAALNNVNCTGVVPAWLTTVPQSRTGYDGNSQTREFTKILPDGLFTPGSHIEYFYRKSHAIDPFVRFAMCPDTTAITPQNSEGSSDQHRWQQFGVLPDRWKNNAFGGLGAACMLYIDLNDRRGNEGRFVATMDSVGATSANKYGSHNGWHADGTVNLFNWDPTIPGVAVSNRNSQPGTTWDLYGVKASESLTTSAGAPGARLANRSNLQFAAGHEAKSGPTPEMLRVYYRIVAILSGDLNSGILGPFTNRSQNDISLLNDFLATTAGSAQPRGILIQGDGFGQSEKATGGIDPTHTAFLTDKLGVIFRKPSYQSLSGNTNGCADLLTTTSLTPANDVYGVANSCAWSNDVYQRNPAIAESAEGAFYENVGLSGPYVSDVVKPNTVGRPWVAVTSGFEIEHLYSRYCNTDNGRLAYYYYMLNKAFAVVCQITGAASATLDTPQGGRAYTNFMKIGNSVMKQGPSFVRFSVAKAGRVQVSIFDVTGRKIRNLADRVFPAGEHSIQWDGTDDAGSKVARGVYFVRSSVQKDAGRIIVLNN